jgi:pyrimidine-nucleoside phosphorylase
MRAYDIIKKKRDGFSLTKAEIDLFLTSFLKSDIADYQVSAFLMAVLLKGMTREEARYLTEIMLRSGSVIDLSDIAGPKIDKHSTGGVGDKVSLILAPLMASAGVIVPMIAGRGLGHTGGTLDKLESIPGFKTSLSIDEFKSVLSKSSCSIIGASEEIAPLDRKLYALRDVTATVESIPLITASIMSKKLSEGIQGLVLDVKVGSGAFMKDLESARELAESLVDVGNSFGIKTIAVITDMNEPLGMAVGNSLEVRESIDVLRGKGTEDLLEVALYLGALMLKTAGIEEDIDAGRLKLNKLIEDGAALEKFKEMVHLQGGNVTIFERPSLLHSSCLSVEIDSQEEGYIQSIDAGLTGTASMMLGAGRKKMDSVIDHTAGILLKKRSGDYVMKDETLCTFCTSDEESVAPAKEVFLSGVKFGKNPPAKRKMIVEVLV